MEYILLYCFVLANVFQLLGARLGKFLGHPYGNTWIFGRADSYSSGKKDSGPREWFHSARDVYARMGFKTDPGNPVPGLGAGS